jgi:hypothetical protein
MMMLNNPNLRAHQKDSRTRRFCSGTADSMNGLAGCDLPSQIRLTSGPEEQDSQC